MSAAVPPRPSDDDRALVGEYVLGLLEPAVARAVEDRLAAEPALRAERAAWEEALLPVAEAPEAAPPRALRRRVEAAVFPEEARARRRAPWGLAALLGAPAAAAVLLAAFFFAEPAPVPFVPTHAASLAAEDGSLALEARADGRRLEVVLARGAAPEGRDLEIWLIAGGAAPVSLGVVGGDGTLRAAVPGALTPGAVLAASEEPPGGSPTGAPTGAVLALGTVTQL
ncbi:anti-sigma factor domain-containing protein [Jannaschia sp. W003]|uniref:anti-sigma factor n=1 Tax=Jannaschia sp. W003 TaxID=2867012 RepID=UPI0021A33669|nr:anti-sigma factor [Jannaschia sp. W003]UWQ21068.1 anti-sigma factor [Jannaschia sp. W003]